MGKKSKEEFLIRCDFSKGNEFISPEKVDKVLSIERDRFQKARKSYPDYVPGKLYPVRVSFRLPFPLKAKFIGTIKRYNGKEAYEVQVVEIESGDRKGYFIRGEPLTVSTSEHPFYFCIPIYPELEDKDPYSLTDRGLCWIYQDKRLTSCELILVNWYKKTCKKGQIAEIIQQARKQVQSEVEKALFSTLDLSKVQKMNE